MGSRMYPLLENLPPDFSEEPERPAFGISPNRLDVGALWATLPDEDKAMIGELALGMLCSGHTAGIADSEYDSIAARAATAAAFSFEEWMARAEMPATVESAIRDDLGFRIAEVLGPICRGCGCSDSDACEDGCAWADEAQTTCTACVAKAEAKARDDVTDFF
ncbi:hypothetical protein [Methylobacterium sp. 37f]|uniref:hypothetical protein n=1 Tax=Methylobacterium sp. 37f TaxID=2817058 RepID=UPI001FFCAC04|nr:hypothetical protein [Methylobacterium sp. 37f]MCK2057222.1 hypothetical protein [Methylobacterium sp. 37f]